MRLKNPEALKNTPLPDVSPIPVDRNGIPGFVAVSEGVQRFYTNNQYQAITESRLNDLDIQTITPPADFIELPARNILGADLNRFESTIKFAVASKPQVHIPSVAEMRKSYQEYLSQLNMPKVSKKSTKAAS